jgi:hypothetical protein
VSETLVIVIRVKMALAQQNPYGAIISLVDYHFVALSLLVLLLITGT